MGLDSHAKRPFKILSSLTTNDCGIVLNTAAGFRRMSVTHLWTKSKGRDGPRSVFSPPQPPSVVYAQSFSPLLTLAKCSDPPSAASLDVHGDSSRAARSPRGSQPLFASGHDRQGKWIKGKERKEVVSWRKQHEAMRVFQAQKDGGYGPSWGREKEQ